MEINGKEVVIKPYTRGIDRQYNDKLLEGVEMRASADEQNMDIPAVNIGKAQDVLVRLMTDLTAEEVDALPLEEYNKLLFECNKVKEGKKK